MCVERPLVPTISFDLTQYNDERARIEFRSKLPQLQCLCVALRLPTMIKITYSGHKREHCLGFQSITTPDGLTIHFWGPTEGRRHDITLLRLSAVVEQLTTNSEFQGKLVCGNPA
ncbi:TPA: hypothetical protein N0F65_008757 [Lagenidium giganteum]|uniref:DDE Tnp4 domain-containing protein n=1 Tax=Lagenidium giganteum TaxID=4803 RepID=A0AAV2YY67_9STRA|nr:TPA: hypothetical protein N0F65_008757 [Lagenidium giganteum]